MPIVTISRGTFSGGRSLAAELCQKLGCDCIESEVLGDAARQLGVPVSRLKAAMVKAPSAQRGFAREREMYLASITVALGERALARDLVYHGHAAHLLLPGVAHVLRVRVTADPEYRVRAAMDRMSMTRTQAKRYIAAVDADRARWVDFLYGIDWTDPSHYDLVLNLEHLSVQNAAHVVCGMCELPDFQPTPASLRRLNDVLLAARARVRLGVDARTAQAEVVVKANHGVLSVKHMPRQAQLAPVIRDVLEGIEGVRDIQCAIASSTLLWVEDEFAPSSGGFEQVAEIARRWDAAVELLKLLRPGSPEHVPTVPADGFAVSLALGATFADGGVRFEDEAPVALTTGPQDEGMKATLDALRKMGRAGDGHALPADRVPGALDPGTRYSLVVVGDVFQEKPESVRGRLARELTASLAEHLNVPVVGVQDIRRRLAFGPRNFAALITALVLVVATYILVFGHQDDVVRFVALAGSPGERALHVTVLILAVPLFAYLYGSAINLIARMLRFD
jgi:cytidylate kinase